MKFSAVLLAAAFAQTAAFAPSAPMRSCTSLFEAKGLTPAQEEDLAKTFETIYKYKLNGEWDLKTGKKKIKPTGPPPVDVEYPKDVPLEELMKREWDSVELEITDINNYRVVNGPAVSKASAAAPAAPAAAPAKSSTGIELWSVDYDAAAMLAYKAAGSSGDFEAFKTKYLAETSEMCGKKNPYTK